MFTIHQIGSDSFTKDLFLKEFQQLYRGIPVKEPLAYTDFVNWESEMLKSPWGEKLWQYWEKQLAGELPILDLPTDLPRPSLVTYRSDSHEFKLNEELLSRLKQLQSDSISLFQIALSAFYVLLYRYTNQKNILVNIPTENRRGKKEFKDVAGYLASLVVVPGNLEGNTTFKELLIQVAQTVDQALKHEAYNYPLSQLLKQLKLKSNFRHPLVSFVMFNWRKLRWDDTDFPDELLQIQPYLLEEQRGAPYDLSVEMIEVGDQLNLRWNYNSDLFYPETIDRIASHYLTLLEGIVANQETPIFQLPLLTETERHQLLIEWNNTQVDYPQDKCIHQLFEEQVEKTPDAVAVVFDREQLTYREFNCRANQLAHYLRKLGVKPDTLVGIFLEPSLEMVVSIYGVLKAGGAYVPLAPGYPRDRITHILETSQASILLTQQNLTPQLTNHHPEIVCLDQDWNLIEQESPKNFDSSVTSQNLAYAIYTSGSTGKPKGVMIPHQALVNHLNWMQTEFPLSVEDKVLQKTPFCFDASVWEFYASLLVGGQLVIAGSGGHQDPAYLIDTINKHSLTILQVVPTLLQMLLSEGTLASCPSLKRVFCGGELLSKDLLSKFETVQKAELINLYGPTEATIDASYYPCQAGTQLLSVPIGRPVANTQIYILDSHLQPVPIGVPGELHIGGAGLARGYLNCPELTEQKFIPNPFSNKPGSRLYKTGDLARYLPDGNIEFIGRIDHQVKIRGFRIELSEIEAVLAQHSNVREAVVIAREDIPGDQRLVAYLITNDAKTTINDLRSFLKTKLPDYMIPSAFVILESLPLTPNGKVNLRGLPVPDASSLLRETSFVAPRDSMELQLAQIWSEVLGISPIGIHDNFIELGGHSLLATKIMARLRDRFQVELSLNCLFEYPTVAELAKIVTQVAQQEGSNRLPSLEPISRQQTIPLSFAQEQLWFLTQLTPSEPVYNETLSIHLGGDINIQALSNSLTELIRRHEILRTTFRVVNGQPVQEIHPPSTLTLPVVDLRFLLETERETEGLRIATEQLGTAFELARGPLLRATLIQLAETDYRLYLAVHHIVVDGESLTCIFWPELEILYTAFYQGLPSPLPELTIQYADFALWQRQWLQGEILSNQLAYWEKQLENLPQLQLPTDRAHTPQTTFAGSRLCFTLSKDLTEKLKTMSRKEGVTLFMTLATAIKVLLYRYSSQEDIVIGTVTSQRNRPELQGVMGDFLNTLVVRSDLSGHPSFSGLLKRVRNVILSAYANQDVPFEQVVNALHPDRHVSQNPLFQVMFVLQPPLTDDKLGWTVSQLEVDSGTSKFNLTFNLEERPEGMIGAIEYNTDLFDATTIDRAIGHFMTLLEGIVANPETSIAQLPLLTEAERHQLLVEWNDTAVNYPQDKCIHQLFEEQVERTPDAVAVAFEEQTLTYQELNGQANQLAHYLRKLGVKPDTLVGIFLEPSLEMVVSIYGVLKAGGAYVPLAPGYPRDRITHILETSQASILLTQQNLTPQLTNHHPEIVCLDQDWNLIEQESPKNFDSSVTSQNLAYAIYTSGSTGKPKGVMIPHQALVNHLNWMQTEFPLSVEDKVLQKTPFCFDASVWEFYASLLVGGQLVIAGSGGHQDPAYLIDTINKHSLTILQVVPTLLQMLLSEGTLASCPSLKRVFCGGELLSKDLLSKFETVQKAELINLYGPTEATIDASYYPCQAGTQLLSVPIGRPVANTQIYILDSHLQPVPIGVPGEL
ncbi:non-ribosomal peptide synthetase, partial [Moorena sp. SIO1G6]|uniref:non-ribosomal peptide synthetase n=1 Tax=Moorena sp. SIO1G6 TaxID=2607840 RepID=UPI002579CB02